MTPPFFSDKELIDLENIISDLDLLFQHEIISLNDVSQIEKSFKSKEVLNYLEDLRAKSKPETSLRERLISSTVLSKYLFGELLRPEVSTTEGFIDYRIEKLYPILIELKPTFVPSYDNKGNLKNIKKEGLNWIKHKTQIEKYRYENEYLIFTNLEFFYFFSRRSNKPMNDVPIKLTDIFKDYKGSFNIVDYIERLEDAAIKDSLEDNFYESLKNWVKELSEIKFKEEISDYKKLEIVIKSINKFIFIQTLDDFSIIEFQWIYKNWLDNENKWLRISSKMFLEEFFTQVNKWFYTYYDTDLFVGTILDGIYDDENNYNNLYEKIKIILGIEEWQKGTTVKGIINYNYRKIDEDIFGKSYENYLAEVRKEQGIYYTPKYITTYIAKETVGIKFELLTNKIIENINSNNFDDANKDVNEFINIKILDPACGSGSFLIKAIKIIWNNYTKLINNINIEMNKNQNFIIGTLIQNKNNKEKYNSLNFIKNKLYVDNNKILISKIILRHIYGNDLDERALEIAKINIWLQAIKLAPLDFHYEKIVQGKGHVLPSLEINLSRGNTLVGLPENFVINYLINNKKKELEKISTLREQYINDISKQNVIIEIIEIIKQINNELNIEFKQYLTKKEVPTDIITETIPLHWPLRFWFAYQGESPGFDIVIGNPPYLFFQEGTETFRNYLRDEFYTPHRNYDIYIVFIEKGLILNKRSGLFSYIVPNKFFKSQYGDKLKNYISENSEVLKIIDFLDAPVFQKAKNYACILFLEKGVKKLQDEILYVKDNRDPEDTIRLLNEDKSSDLFHVCV